jgi:co-chaperonin GroES (HSP10)
MTQNPPPNTSGYKPVGRAVLVSYHEPERKDSAIIIPENVREREVTVEQRGVVIEVGGACWPNEPARAQPGDKVLMARYAGWSAKGIDGKMYRIVNDSDIFAQITGDF